MTVFECMRENFHKTLRILVQQNTYDGIPPRTYEDARIELGNAIPSPVKLYRMDVASDESRLSRRLDDIRKSRLYLADTNSFDDAHDAIPYINKELFIERTESAITGKNMRVAIQMMRPLLSREEYDFLLTKFGPGFDVPERDVRQASEEMMSSLATRLKAFRAGVRVACLTEDVVHQSIWSTYAGKGDGIACEYQLAGLSDYKVLPDNTRGIPVTLCPIEYSGRYDLAELSHVPFGSQSLIPYWTEATYLSLIAAASHKSEDWASQREWRLIALVPANCPEKLYVSLRTTAIYLGLGLSDTAREAVMAVAEEVKVPVYEAHLSYESSDTELRFNRVQCL